MAVDPEALHRIVDETYSQEAVEARIRERLDKAVENEATDFVQWLQRNNILQDLRSGRASVIYQAPGTKRYVLGP